MKFLDSQNKFSNSTELGSVTEETEKESVAETWLIGASIVSVGTLLAWLSYFEIGWHGVGFWSFVTAAGFVVAIVHKLGCYPGNQIFRVHENGICFIHEGVSTEIHYSQLDEYCCKKTMVFFREDPHARCL